MQKFIFQIAMTWLILISPTHADYSMINIGKGQFLLHDELDQNVIKINSLSFKAHWQWMGTEEVDFKEKNNISTYSYQLDKGNITWNLEIQPQDKTLFINSHLQSASLTPLTYIALAFTPDKALKDGHILTTDVNGQSARLKIPLKKEQLTNITQLQFFNANNEKKLTVDFKQPANIHNDRNARIKLAEGEIRSENEIHQKITLTLPKKIKFFSQASRLPKQEKHTRWFPFSPKNTAQAGEIGMQDWLKIKHEKIWGTNVEYHQVAPKKNTAIKRTQFFAKYGINDVRLHKLTNSGWEGLGSTNSASEYDPIKMSRFDYWLHQLSQNGIGYGFSPIWDLRLYPDDKKKLLAYDEIVKLKPKKPTTTGLVWFAKDVQDLHIETIVNLLNHKNPHTKLRYAKDPSLTYIEIQNEENVFFYPFFAIVKKYPTYHKLLAEQFSDWLTVKYQTHSRLVNAWGASAIDTFKREGAFPDEELSKRNITPLMNPWLYDNQATKGRRAKRLQDTAEFLFEKQQQYYSRATQAIRETGYKGTIVSSNWQAGSKGAHFLNLLSDASSGIIDRHNYQGGAQGRPGHLMKSGFELNNYTMLGNPGSGLLSVGMQQVANLPFMFSEWLAVLPSEWAAADTSIVAAYGFGLQGWDMSYHFASNGEGFSPQLAYPGEKKFNTLTPVGVGLYPVLSRMVLRGDITEAAPIAIRRLSKEQAITNSYDFKNTIEHQHDIKSFSGTPHHHSLAAGKVLLEFTNEKGISSIQDWEKKYLRVNTDKTNTITSSTNELKWTYTEGTQKGFVEINSKGTQGIIGFTKDRAYLFNDFSIQPHSPYSVILATAKSPTGTLQSDKEAIIIAIARAHNTDMNIKGSLITNIGKAPVILEPVKATLNFTRKATIEVLDHDGIGTGKTYSLKDGVFELDTGKDKTIYYLVRFED